AHAVAADHRARETRGAIEVVRGAGRLLVVDDDLGGAAGEERLQPIDERASRRQEAIVLGRLHRVAERGVTAGHDGDLADGIGMLRERGHERVSGLVVGDASALVLVEPPALSLGAGDDALDRLVDVRLLDLFLPGARGEEGRLVEDVREIGAREARRAGRDVIEVDPGREGLLARVDLENLLTAAHVGSVDDDLPIEAAGPKEGGVEHVRTVRRGEEDDALRAVETIHLDEELIERLLALVVPAAETRAAMPTDRVELVDEDDARRLALRLLEEVADARGADPDEHLDEVRAAEREE